MQVFRQTLRHSATSVISIGFRACIGIGFSALTAITLVMCGSMIAGHRPMSDPYAVVSDFFDGDARQVALAHGFTCHNPDYPATPSDFCRQLNSAQGNSSIFVRISGGIVKEVGLQSGKNTLTLGDLILLWGEPHTQRYCETDVDSWASHQLIAEAALPRTRQINFFQPISTISFVHHGLPYLLITLQNDLLHGCGDF